MHSTHIGSALFPYTPLFRSRVVRPEDPGRVEQVVALVRQKILHVGECLARRRRHVVRDRRALANVPPAARKALANIDRKSTRLNSSHITISYAVFCLKKKTK